MSSTPAPDPKPVSSDKWRIDIFATLLGAVAILTLVTLTRVVPAEYFAYSELVIGYSGNITPLAILLRFAIPFVVGFAMIWRNGVTSKEATASAIFVSFLLVWPTIIAPENTLSADLYERRYLLYLVYLLFTLAFTYMARAGASIGLHVRQSHTVRTFLAPEKEKLRESTRTVFLALAGAIIYSLLQNLWTGIK